MKNTYKITVALLFSILLIGCSNQSEGTSGESKEELTYSNLVAAPSQAEVRKSMTSAGIPVDTVDIFFEDVNFFNQVVEETGLTDVGFVTIDSLEPEYDVVKMLEMWEAKNPEFLGYNCRITSYDLMKDSISIGNIDTTNIDFLTFDEYAIMSSPRELFSEVEYEEFQTLYSYIPTDLTKEVAVHVENIQKDWQNKEIEFFNDEKRSLVSVFFHEEEGYLFIGHMGLLLPTEDGKLLFLEKLSFQEPYQAIKFANRLELNDYLMNKYDTSWDQPTAAPFIMENDQLLEGYREISDN